MYIDHSLIPRPTQLSIACSTEKWGEPGNFLIIAWLNWKMAKVFWTNRQCFEYCSTDCMLNAWCVQQSPTTTYIHAVSYLVPLLFWAQCTYAQLKPFYDLFYPNITWHMRKDTRPSTTFPHYEVWKAGWDMETQGYIELAVRWNLKVTYFNILKFFITLGSASAVTPSFPMPVHWYLSQSRLI